MCFWEPGWTSGHAVGSGSEVRPLVLVLHESSFLELRFLFDVSVLHCPQPWVVCWVEGQTVFGASGVQESAFVDEHRAFPIEAWVMAFTVAAGHCACRHSAFLCLVAHRTSCASCQGYCLMTYWCSEDCGERVGRGYNG